MFYLNVLDLVIVLFHKFGFYNKVKIKVVERVKRQAGNAAPS